ncbi:MAG: HDIG domain-containing protein [Paludibacteraceae bacterium]|nr:HDIG domain-containing protein [Paludibacteraceae bacterium]
MKPALKISLQILAFVILAALSIYLLPRQQHSVSFDYTVGRPWGYGLLKADMDFPILKTEAELSVERARLLKDFVPVYKPQIPLDSTGLYILSVDEMARVEKNGWQYIKVAENNVSNMVPLQDLHTPKTAYQLTGKNLPVNIIYDTIKSESIRDEYLEDMSLVHGMVFKGTKIVDSGEIVTDEIAQIILSFSEAKNNSSNPKSQSLMPTFASAICVVCLLLIFFLYLFTYRRKLLDNLRNVLFFTILMAIIISAALLLLAYVPSHEFVYLIPFVWAPIIARVFYDSRTAIFLHIITVSIVSLAVTMPYVFLLTQVLVGIVAVISLRDMTQRAQLAQTAAFVLISYSLIYTALHVLTAGDWQSINWHFYVLFAVNAVLVICAYGLIFLFERGFGLLSSITLVELTNVNSNLMLQFAEKAPGTFQHSLQVSNLATEAAKRIGAKVLLVRTGALYHDIGKMSNANYFIENQSEGNNPLTGMETAAAAKVVIEHVVEGERIARQHNLPELIVHFIRSHHGNSQTRYFYNTAINQAKQAGLDPSAVDAAEYSYPGPKPSTKEAAIIMMADAIEARSRSLKEMTPQSISDMVDDMINMQMQDGQLAETPLSFKDLEDVRVVFKQKLLEINHHRIIYPKVE